MGGMYCWICMKNFCPTHPWHQPPIQKETAVSTTPDSNSNERQSEKLVELQRQLIEEMNENKRLRNTESAQAASIKHWQEENLEWEHRYELLTEQISSRDKLIKDLTEANTKLEQEVKRLKDFYSSFEQNTDKMYDKFHSIKRIIESI